MEMLGVLSLRAATVRNLDYVKMGSIDEIRHESDILRNGTLCRIDEMKREIELLIAEYDGSLDDEMAYTPITKVTGDDFEPLANSVRVIKLKNS